MASSSEFDSELRALLAFEREVEAMASRYRDAVAAFCRRHGAPCGDPPFKWTVPAVALRDGTRLQPVMRSVRGRLQAYIHRVGNPEGLHILELDE